jgi:hypothetical protein
MMIEQTKWFVQAMAALSIMVVMALASCVSRSHSVEIRDMPTWVQNLEQVYPAREWIAVIGQGASRGQAEAAAMSALARAFKTDVASLTRASLQFSQIVTEAAGKKSVVFNENEDFAEEVTISSNVQGLIGVQTDTFQADNEIWYAAARMNRAESAVRYAGITRENAAVIDSLLRHAAAGTGFEAYAALSFAAAIAAITDNFQNILEALDPTAAGHRPSYGGVNAIRMRMLETAGKIIVGIAVETGERQDAALIRRALGSFFTDRGFNINERGNGDYTLRMAVRFEPLSQQLMQSCRYYIDAALERKDGRAIYTFTTDDRASHLQASEARRLAAHAVETAVKEGVFAADFEKWLNTLLD